MKKYILLVSMFISLLFASCEYDNHEEPNAILSGKVVYDGKPVGVRTEGAQLELWQDGFQLFTKIPVHIAHDGSFSAAVYDGKYKLVRLAGAPWETQGGDTIVVDVRGNTVVEVPVKPYFVISNENITKEGTKITAKFTVNEVVQSADIAEVRLYLSKYVLTDQNRNEHAISADVSAVVAGQETSLTTEIPTGLSKNSYIYVRIGVRSTLSNEFYYTQVQKINL